jgi:enamine deaminase RidA (YjgF/YER057c/UK114 family)
MADYDAMNRAWDGWVDPENPPARCCGTSQLAEPEYLIEIIATAAA